MARGAVAMRQVPEIFCQRLVVVEKDIASTVESGNGMQGAVDKAMPLGGGPILRNADAIPDCQMQLTLFVNIEAIGFAERQHGRLAAGPRDQDVALLVMPLDMPTLALAEAAAGILLELHNVAGLIVHAVAAHGFGHRERRLLIEHLSFAEPSLLLEFGPD